MQNAKDVFHWSGGMRQPPRAGGGVPAFRVFAPPHPCPRPLPSPLHPTTPIPKGGLCGAFFLKGDSG